MHATDAKPFPDVLDHVPHRALALQVQSGVRRLYLAWLPQKVMQHPYLPLDQARCAAAAARRTQPIGDLRRPIKTGRYLDSVGLQHAKNTVRHDCAVCDDQERRQRRASRIGDMCGSPTRAFDRPPIQQWLTAEELNRGDLTVFVPDPQESMASRFDGHSSWRSAISTSAGIAVNAVKVAVVGDVQHQPLENRTARRSDGRFVCRPGRRRLRAHVRSSQTVIGFEGECDRVESRATVPIPDCQHLAAIPLRVCCRYPRWLWASAKPLPNRRDPQVRNHLCRGGRYPFRSGRLKTMNSVPEPGGAYPDYRLLLEDGITDKFAGVCGRTATTLAA